MAEAERRRSPRYEVGLPVACRTVAERRAGLPSLIGMTWNVSRGGLQVELPVPPPKGVFELVLQVGSQAVTARGRLAWMRASPERVRCGFALTAMAPTHGAAWEAFLARQQGPTARRYVRVAIDLPMTCRLREAPEVVLTGRLENISDGGMLARLPTRLQPAQEVEVDLATAQSPLTVTAAVTWTDREPPPNRGGFIRHGLRFLPPGGEGVGRRDLFLVRALIAEFLRQTGVAPAD